MQRTSVLLSDEQMNLVKEYDINVSKMVRERLDEEFSLPKLIESYKNKLKELEEKLEINKKEFLKDSKELLKCKGFNIFDRKNEYNKLFGESITEGEFMLLVSGENTETFINPN